MRTPIRDGGRWSTAGRPPIGPAWPMMLALGLLVAGPETSPCSAQVTGSGPPSALGTPAPSTMPGGGAAAGLAPQPGGAMSAGTGAAGAQPALGGLPALPGSGGISPAPTGASSAWNTTGAVQPEPVPMPPRAEAPQPVGPLPLPSMFRLPSLAFDHYGDGAGTVGAGLIWMGQLPEQYRISRYRDGNGKVGGPIPHLAWITPHASTVNTKGTLSYGPPGLHPGFNGFGLSFHPGYGYGGNALGTGALGGYPCYGGPGYPLHYGYPKFAYPYYEGIGQLYFDQPVVITDLVGAGDFGPYTGASAYAYVHPSFATEAAATGSFQPGRPSFPDTNATNPAPEATITPGESIPGEAGMVNRPGARDLFLGMVLRPSTAAGGRSGLRITGVLPGSTAEGAGLNVGDVILSVNGRPTQDRPQLDAILAGAGPGTVLKMNVLRASGGAEQEFTIRMP